MTDQQAIKFMGTIALMFPTIKTFMDYSASNGQDAIKQYVAMNIAIVEEVAKQCIS